MSFSAEILFMLGVVCLYIYDSALLLGSSEAVFSLKRHKRWAVDFGARNYTVNGKEVFIPNPLLFHRPIARASWFPELKHPEASKWESSHSIFEAIKIPMWLIALALFVGFPLGFFTRLGDSALLMSIMVLLFSIAVALGWIWICRVELNVTTKRFLFLAFESIVCPPFALNLVRHVSLGIPVQESLVTAAQRILACSEWELTRQKLLVRMKEELEIDEPDTPRYRELSIMKTILQEAEPCQG